MFRNEICRRAIQNTAFTLLRDRENNETHSVISNQAPPVNRCTFT